MATGSENAAQRWAVAGLPILLPLVLFLVLRPDRVYVQNGLDPFFYTGYAQNFDDIAAIVRDLHYSISRWTLYMPGRVTDALFGPLGGYLTLRWAAAALLAGAVVVFGRGRWSLATTVHLAVLTLVGPMVLRAIFTDYTDTVVVPCAALALALVARRSGVLLAGVLMGAAVVAQPTAVTVAGSAAAAYVLVASGRRRALRDVGVAACGAAALVLAGLLWFRWRYRIGNVYAPTIDFIRDSVSYQDPLRSPRSLWLAYYLWDYLPAVVLAVAVVLHRRDRTRFDTAERTVLVALALQYAFQIAYQFLRHGTTLELVYYWNYILPSLVLATAVVVGSLLRRVPDRAVVLVTVVLVMVLAVAPRPFPSAPNWVVVAAVAAGLGALAWWLRARARWLPGTVLTVLVVFVPLWSPRPLPLLPGELQVDVRYHAVYTRDGTGGESAFDAATWFVETMEGLGDEVEHDTFYWMGGGWGPQMGATYGAHISGHALNFPRGTGTPETIDLPPSTVELVESGFVRHLAVLGTDDEVDEVLAWLEDHGLDVEVLLDDHEPTVVATRAVVAELTVAAGP